MSSTWLKTAFRNYFTIHLYIILLTMLSKRISVCRLSFSSFTNCVRSWWIWMCADVSAPVTLQHLQVSLSSSPIALNNSLFNVFEYSFGQRQQRLPFCFSYFMYIFFRFAISVSVMFVVIDSVTLPFYHSPLQNVGGSRIESSFLSIVRTIFQCCPFCDFDCGLCLPACAGLD